jgi:hypothetical protein
MSVSNLDHDISYPELNVSWILSLSPGERRNMAHDCLLPNPLTSHISRSSHLTRRYRPITYDVETASLNDLR